MRTFGWAPTEGELQELVGEIDQVIENFLWRNWSGTQKKISSPEINQVLEKKIWRLKKIAKDGNGCITFNEFVWLMTRFQIEKI